MTLSIKMEPELRHVLAHMIYAIEALVNGDTAEAQYEVESIKGLVFWDSDRGQTADAEEWLERNENGEEMHKEELQEEGRQEKLQEEIGAGGKTPKPVR